MSGAVGEREGALAATVNALRAAFRSSPDSVFVIDTENRFLMVNETLCQFLRVTEDQLLGQPYDRSARSTDAERIREAVAVALDGTWSRYRNSGTRLNGEEFIAEVTLFPLRLSGDDVVGVVGIAVDLTEVEAQEVQARRGADLLRLAGRIARFGGWSVDAATRAIDLSEGARHLLGIANDEPNLSEAAWALHPEEERPRITEHLERCMTDGTPFELESVMFTTTGERLVVRTVGEPERRTDGVIIGARGAILDVTAEATARQRMEYQAALIDNARDAMLVREVDGTVLFWNRGAVELYGWSQEEAVGRSAYDLIGMEPSERAAAIDELMRTGYFSGEVSQRTRDGRTIIVDVRWQLLVDDEGETTGVFAVNTDITEYRREQENRQRAQRLESLGTLAGGIAHDLNNVLTPILMSVQLLAQDEADQERREMLRTMEAAAKRGAEMIRQVLTFARGVDGRRVSIDPNVLLDDLVSLTRDLVPRGITVTVQRDTELGTTVGDPTQLLQVLVNLITNARDAVGDDGHISITANTLTILDEYSSVSHAAAPGSYLQIAVEDNGHGMPPAVAEKVFEPFFTTKPHGRGTGLGLSTSLSIVRGHGGFMQVYSEEGRGTRFIVGLPIDTSQPEGAAQAAEQHASELPRGEGEVILVVDDEESIRSVARRTLEAYGYRVLVAGNGQEAIAEIENGSTPVALVITDMMMPVMDGAATTAYLEEHHPDLPIIASSGLSSGGESGSDPGGVGMGIARFLAKPYTTHTLITSVSDTLREHRTRTETQTEEDR
ncbi:hybrid sensor histidine kinase/response regulator [Microcella frigidaquae]|uniref:histidine kinase n=1 Tax=Microcella frigidaquae TaxID=424758 RepID=A0A840X7P5_9MICO|nr:PAS domain S-box protein [Microcella frigidaquae]MBB5617175.1 PAS domain S-box-containing protein [Microcella frigidaquae]NHN45125.1 PAS domain S-box protein [Microcella frigidaquae]